MEFVCVETSSPSASASELSSTWWHDQLIAPSPSSDTPSSVRNSPSPGLLCMSSGTASSAVTSDSLLDAISSGLGHVVADLVATCQSTGFWPISPATCIFAAVKLGKTGIVEQLLAAGAPAQFLVRQLPHFDRAALSSSGISADGVDDMSPLVIAVRQHNLEVARLLLGCGASAQDTIADIPLLLHYCESMQAAPSSSSGLGPSTSLSGGGSSSRLTLGQQAGSGSGQAAAAASLGGGGGGSSSANSVMARIYETDAKLQLLWLLLHNGADPLQAPLGDPLRSFLTACREAPLLRLAVNYVRHQCEHGRQLSEFEAHTLVQAAGRAFLGGC